MAPVAGGVAESTCLQTVAHATREEQAITETIEYMYNRGKWRDELQRKRIKIQLRTLAKKVNIFDSQAVLQYITHQKTKDGTDTKGNTKNNLTYLYDCFCEVNQIPFDAPHFAYKAPIPLLPSSDNVYTIINASSPQGYQSTGL
jgi:hypothetical protein